MFRAPVRPVRRWRRRVVVVAATILTTVLGTLAPTLAPTGLESGSTAAARSLPSVLALPRVPWEGGPAYWSAFPKAREAGWTKDTFFPVVVWYGSCISAEQMAFDKTYGVNTYAQCNAAARYDEIKSAGMFTLFPSAGQPSDDEQTQQVGTLLDDEVDGRFEPDEGVSLMQDLARQYDPARTGRFTYANWTSGIVTYDRSMAFSTAYYDTADVNSVDQYFYSTPHCTYLSLRWRTPQISSPSSGRAGSTIVPGNCRTSSSYGKMIDLQLEINAARGRTSPIWAVPETVGVGFRQGGPIGRSEVEGMVMSSLIHEARGVMWFSQSFDHESWSADNPCGSGDSFGSVRSLPGYPCAGAMAGVKAVGQLVQQYAPVLNTQSSVWDFGPGTDTMLKVKGSYAYVFAMSDGRPGTRTFTLPGGLGNRVQVLGENRQLAVAHGTFTDRFASESSYHVYRIPLRHRAARG